VAAHGAAHMYSDVKEHLAIDYAHVFRAWAGESAMLLNFIALLSSQLLFLLRATG
jgi:hypothetical protein